VAVVAVEAVEDDSELLVSREVADADLDVAREDFREDLWDDTWDGDRVGSAEVGGSSRRVLRDLDLDFEFEWLMVGVTITQEQYFL
jgi:hypothetical protein